MGAVPNYVTTPRSNYVKLRLTDLEKKDWQRAAGGARKLSEWIRATCNAACIAEHRAELPPGLDPPYEEHLRSLGIPVPNEKPLIVQEAIEDQAHRVSRPLPESTPARDEASRDGVAASGARPGKPGECPRAHFHRAGVYCGSCKRLIGK